ncbi:MAG: AAA family ATPase [Candidatus Binataceae bacterium]
MVETVKIIPIDGDAANARESNGGDVRERIRALVFAGESSITEIAAEADLGASTLSQFLSGTYHGNLAAVAAKLARWLELREERAAADALMPEAAAFAMTPTAKQILATLTNAQNFSWVVEIDGAPGVGKTLAARHYRETHPAVAIVTASPDCAGLVPFLDEVCVALKLTHGSFAGALRLSRRIQAHLAGKKKYLLIVDEAQHLSLPALEMVRSLHDKTGAGIALLGSALLHQAIRGSERGERAQIRSRVAMRLPLRTAAAGDVDRILDSWKLRGTAERKFLAEIARRAGALRTMVRTLALATAAAGADDRKPELDDLRSAWALLGALD